MRTLASGHARDPHRALRLAAVSALVVVILQRTPLGRAIYALGNKERPPISPASIPSASRDLLRALRARRRSRRRPARRLFSKAYQAMGDAYLLPAIAAVVIGGTNILGGRGRYLGTLVGVILIVLLNSVLSIMEMPRPAAR